ncbi:MAG: 2-oxo-4-hydroxy-4-carboxy-5-ureidoimidazoline decarboxylase [Proteobacteria bacterium]|nr:2-oxo-4-hydroxy-4-carboxy-5-ureidoimidazoline decarboxylase [Pseudomonadota bacterium]
MNVKYINAMPRNGLFIEFEKCCGSSAWVKRMVNSRPFYDVESLHEISDKIWKGLSSKDYLEAFTHHPQIGDVDSLKKKFASTANWAGNEQKGATQASDEVLQQLKSGNDEYLKRFGFIFIVCATGKTAQQMLSLLNDRLSNDPAIELHISAAEQNEITHLRLDKLLSI